jgi:hypothetical protein
MDEEEVAKRILVSIGIAMTCAEKLMGFEDVNVRVFALDTFTKMADMEMTLMNALGVKDQTGDSNPLARRARLDR